LFRPDDAAGPKDPVASVDGGRDQGQDYHGENDAAEKGISMQNDKASLDLEY
jgi:hypothetical protein